MRRLILAAAALAAVLGIPAAAQATPGDLDPTFGDSGIVRTHIGGSDSFDRSDAMALDASGRAVVVGTTSTPIGDAELVIARYLSDGSLDPSFGTGGIVKSSAGYPHDVTVDASGRIVVAGRGQEGSETGVLVARFLTTGVPDASFGGGDGVVVKDFTGEFDGAAGVKIDGSGRIVIAGGAPHVLVARFLENGAVDTTFGGGDGYSAETMNDPATGGLLIHGLRDLALDAAGRIVGVSGGFVAMRFTTSGALDTSFGGGDGVVAHRVASGDDATAVAIDSTGGILVGGSTGNAIEEPVIVGFDFAVVRYSESGVLDTAFGDGESMAVADGGLFDYATDLALDGNGRIVLGGAASDFAVARFLPSGRISGSFGGGDGVVTTDVDENDLGTAIAVDASGRVVLSGNAEGEEAEGNTFSDFALLRYEGGPAVDVFHDLSVQTAGDGEGAVTGPGIDCGTTCTATYDEGTVVTLTAIPAHDELGEVEAVFTGWSGDCAGETETCQVTMDAAKEATATFAPLIEEPPVEEPPAEEEPPSESPGEELFADPPAPPPVSPPSGNQQPEAAPRAILATAAGIAPIKGGAALVRLRCGDLAACRGVAKLLTRVRPRQGAGRSAARARNVVLGQSRFRIPAGKMRVTRVHLNATGRRLLRRAGHRGLRVRLAGRGVRNRAVRLKPSQRKRQRSRARRTTAMATASRRKRAKRRKRVFPGTLTLKDKREPIVIPAEPVITFPGHAFHGVLTSPNRACRRNREVFALYEFPPGTEPIVREMWAGYGGGKVKTDRSGVWKAEPAAFQQAVRVTAVVKEKWLRRGRICARVESRPLTLRSSQTPAI